MGPRTFYASLRSQLLIAYSDLFNRVDLRYLSALALHFLFQNQGLRITVL